ncbi:alpha/beta hydrolase [Pseudotabrizicola sp. L79]|uniref:alpha/beta hydrolase n=1 Tax=Pseudotabrizicola sp. L79 TaxID=3118402 RepID=UPI002F925D42
MVSVSSGPGIDLWLPAGDPKATVLYLHGGGFRRGSRAEPFLGGFAARLAGDGVALASASYRLNGTFQDLAATDRPVARRLVGASARSGLGLAGRLYGPAFLVALWDAARAVAELRNGGVAAATAGKPVVVLGMSAGGILGLSLAFPPRVWQARLAAPDAVLAVSAAMVQPWCLRAGGPDCVMLHGSRDRIIPLQDARLAAERAARVGARLTLVESGEAGHVRQLELLLSGQRADGRPWMGLLLDLVAKSAGLPLDGPRGLA